MYFGSVTTTLNTSVTILGVKLSLDTVRTILARALNLPYLDCVYLRDPGNEARVRKAITDLVLDTIRPLIGAKNCDVKALDVVVALTRGAITSSGVPVDAAVALVVDRALCEVINGALSLTSFADRFVRPVYAELVDSCKRASDTSGTGVVVDDRYGVQPPVVQPPQVSSVASDVDTWVKPDVWAPATFKKPKTKSVLPAVVAVGVALAVSTVILSRRR